MLVTRSNPYGLDPFRSPLDGWTPSGAHDQDRQELGARIGSWYEQHEGLRSSGTTEGDYERFIFPNDTPTFQHDAADTMWSCALRLQGCYRVLRVRHNLLATPYAERAQMAVVDAAQVARSFGALVESTADLVAYEPQAGDAICQLGPAGPHVSCIVRAEWQTRGLGGQAALELSCVDGGQGHKGDMRIGRTAYLWDKGRVTPIAGGKSRRLLWAVDIFKLVVESGCLSA